MRLRVRIAIAAALFLTGFTLTLVSWTELAVSGTSTLRVDLLLSGLFIELVSLVFWATSMNLTTDHVPYSKWRRMGMFAIVLGLSSWGVTAGLYLAGGPLRFFAIGLLNIGLPFLGGVAVASGAMTIREYSRDDPSPSGF